MVLLNDFLSNLRRIISTVLGWDISELKKRALAVEKDKDAPNKAQLGVLKAHTEKPAEIHQQYRSESGSLTFPGLTPAHRC